ncbi:MAG TPA: penicillin-binding protein activator [Steroidobacteraceae bacterium]|nr:penicillin-binding protein activator [Steroidobacteraceae bacterium]
MQQSLGRHAAIAAVAVLLLVLQGCAPAPSRAPAPVAPEQLVLDAQRAARAGDHATASARYEAAARASPGDLRDRFLLRAAYAALDAGEVARAESLLGEVTGPLPSADYSLRARVAARIALESGRPERALAEIERIPRPIPREDAAEILALRAQAQFELARPVEGLRTLQERERYLLERDDLEQNRQLIWEGLKASAAAGADFRIPIDADPLTAGWLALGSAAQAAERNPFVAATTFGDWRARYPGHPGNRLLAEQILPEISTGLAYPAQVAVILPLSGRQRAAGIAVRDGFMTAVLEQVPESRPVVRIYDSAEIGANTAYRRALADGAQFVVGPLLKSEVVALAESGDVSVLTLALNQLGDAVPPGMMFQFALDPEAEARQVARRAIADGRRRAAALAPDNAWGQRVHDAFAAEFTALGGVVAGTSFFDPATRDYSQPITSLLLIDESRARLNRLVRTLGTPLEFEPRRRTDVEFVFVAAQPAQGRSLRPALRFHLADDLPVYATSEIFDPQATGNSDLDGILFPDMPWVLSDDETTIRMRTMIAELWPTQARARGRLYAFGFDAYRLIPLLRSQRPGAAAPVAGMTGLLSVDDRGRILRELDWARIVKGQPRPLEPPGFEMAGSP